MKAYLLAVVRVEDFSTYNERYIQHAQPIFAKHKGELIAFDHSPNYLEGDGIKGRIIMVEFPTMDAAEAFYNDPEYQPLKKIRQELADADAILVSRGF